MQRYREAKFNLESVVTAGEFGVRVPRPASDQYLN